MDHTRRVLDYFEAISAIPRGSGREEKISQWLQQFAQQRNLFNQVDPAGNLLIRVPASTGYESAPVIILQGHMDMVCEKTPDSTHNFLTDPIRCIVDGDWLHADNTTLGSDNGIAIALALALVDDATVQHPALELLFTVNEEVGLGGANHLQPGFIQGKILVNLDSEDEGTFIVGCAGGQSTRLSLPLKYENPIHTSAFNLTVRGLRGGHSGVDIHKHFANANKLLARALGHIREITAIGLVNLSGGTAHNAIPREAYASFNFAPEYLPAIQQTIQKLEADLCLEFAGVEQHVELTLTGISPQAAANTADTDKAIQLLLALPHGIVEMSAGVKGFVETSCNLANISIEDGNLKIVTSQRSTVMTGMKDITDRINAIAHLAGAQISNTPAYPGWQPDMQSALLQRSVQTYTAEFGHTPDVRMIHAGLECGTIGSIYPGLDMISLGTTIENPHSPNERLYIPSIGKVWQYLVKFLQTYQ